MSQRHMQRVVWTVLLLGCLGFTPLLYGQERSPSLVGAAPLGEKYARLIGVRQYGKSEQRFCEEGGSWQGRSRSADGAEAGSKPGPVVDSNLGPPCSHGGSINRVPARAAPR
jgi:hypothetical protein